MPLTAAMAVLMALLCAAPGLAQRSANAPTESGQLLEAGIAGILARKGFTILRHGDWNEAEMHRKPQPKFLVTDVPYKSIYGHKARMEFLMIDGARQILIEAKRQGSSGSTDEKLPYVYLNALANLPERAMILVMSGKGWKGGAVKWIRGKAEETDGFYVITVDEFIEWVRLEF